MKKKTMKVRNLEVDVVEVFDGYVLVQSITDGSLFVVDFSELTEYNGETEEESPEVKSNIISIEDFRRCQKRTKTKKQKILV